MERGSVSYSGQNQDTGPHTPKRRCSVKAAKSVANQGGKTLQRSDRTEEPSNKGLQKHRTSPLDMPEEQNHPDWTRAPPSPHFPTGPLCDGQELGG